MPITIARKYKTKDIEMLTATATIIENAIANKAFLQSKRTTWADPFFEDLKTQIQNTTDTYLGKDAAQQMRQATQIVLAIQAQTLNDLAEFKVQIEQDFKSNPTQKTEILTQLGFKTYHKLAQKGDQEGLVNLLFQFKTNLNPTLNAEIVARIEQTFSQNQNDFNAGYNACMVHMVIATSKALTEKGIPWSDVQKTLIEVVDDFHKIANEKKAP